MDFKKTLKQREATKVLSSFRHPSLCGGSRSGKTFLIIYAIIVRASKVKSRHVSLRKHFNSAKTSLWMDTIPKVISLCFPDLSMSWQERNKSDFMWTLPNGSEYWIGGLDDDKRVEKILGKEYSTMHFNECSEIHYQSVQTALTRLAEKNALTKRAYYDFNPPAKSHWTYWQFIKKLNPVDNEPLAYPDDYGHILMNPHDNMDNIDAEYIKMLESLPEEQRNRFLYGLFADASEGQAYYSFNRDEHVKEVSEKIKGQPKLIGMDFNVDPMTCVVGSFVNGIFYIYDERFLKNSDTFKMTKSLTDGGYSGARVYPDSTGKNRKTSGLSDFKILETAGFTIKGVTNPLVVDRVNNINRLLQEGRIVIDPACKKLINDLEKVSWVDGSLDQKTDKYLTHISDALGYLCWAIDPLIDHRESSIIPL